MMSSLCRPPTRQTPETDHAVTRNLECMELSGINPFENRLLIHTRDLLCGVR